MDKSRCPVPRLFIERCSDSAMWYKELVGQIVPLRFQDEEGFWANEPAGYLNVVKLSDGRVVFEGGVGDE